MMGMDKQLQLTDQDSCAERIEGCLSEALAADTPNMKNYHTRRAFQYFIILTDNW